MIKQAQVNTGFVESCRPSQIDYLFFLGSEQGSG